MNKALIKKQFLQITAFVTQDRRTGRRRSRLSTVGFGLLFLYLAVVMLGSFGSIAAALCDLLEPMGLSWLYFVYMLLLALMVSTLTGAFLSHSMLFAARDNELLLSLPIPVSQILAVRMLWVYLIDLGYFLLVFLPAEAVYAVKAAHPAGALLAAVPVALLSAGASTAVSCLLGWAIAAFAARVRRKSLVTILLSLAFCGFFLLGWNWLQQDLNRLLAQSLQTGLLQDPGSAMLKLLGSAVCGQPGALAATAAVLLAVLAAAYLLLARQYGTLITTRRGAAKAVYHEKALKKSGVSRALLLRELRRLGSSAPYMLNGALGTVLLPVGGAAVLWKAEELRVMLAQLPAEFCVPLMCAAGCMAACVNLITAPSVSLEGKTLWLMQSLPVAPQQVLQAKLRLHLLLTLPPAAFCLLCLLAVCRAAAAESLLCFAVLALFVLFTAQFGLMMGILMPDLNWTSEAVVVKQGMATLVALFGGWATLLALGLVYLLLAGYLPEAACLGLTAAVLAAADLLLARWLNRSGAARFAAL